MHIVSIQALPISRYNSLILMCPKTADSEGEVNNKSLQHIIVIIDISASQCALLFGGKMDS